jgi:hypothetical protein
VGTGGWELVATDEPAVVAKPLLDSIVVENGQGDGGFPDPAGADESDWTKVFERDGLLPRSTRRVQRRSSVAEAGILQVRWVHDVRYRVHLVVKITDLA